MTDLTDDQVKALLDEMTREVICGELDKALAERIGRALLDARAEIDTTQTQVGDWIVRADEANVKVEKLEAELARVKADAAAAQALVVEQCARGADRRYAAGDMGNPGHHIRALASVDGLAMVQELRAERDYWKQMLEKAEECLTSANSIKNVIAAERDRLAAENARIRAAKAVAG